MTFEKSCGAFIIKNKEVLLIKSINGEYGFPKGHMENNETEKDTTIREVKEETNILIDIDPNYCYKINYFVKNNILKEVVYYKGIIVDDSNIVKQDSEIDCIEWININEVINYLPFDNIKNIWLEFLKDNRCV